MDRELAGRAELLATFHLNPFRSRGWTVYGGAGAAVQFAESEAAEYVVAVIGAESKPARAAGAFVEIGVGGGLRAAAGIRFRRSAWATPPNGSSFAERAPSHAFRMTIRRDR